MYSLNSSLYFNEHFEQQRQNLYLQRMYPVFCLFNSIPNANWLKEIEVITKSQLLRIILIGMFDSVFGYFSKIFLQRPYF